MMQIRSVSSVGRVAIVLMLALCTPGCSVRAAVERDGETADVVHFYVASSCDHKVLENVSVSIVMRNGETVPAGKTASNGQISIDRTRLEGAQLVLFCAEDYFCSALATPRAAAGAEILVQLAPFAVM